MALRCLNGRTGTTQGPRWWCREATDRRWARRSDGLFLPSAYSSEVLTSNTASLAGMRPSPIHAGDAEAPRTPWVPSCPHSGSWVPGRFQGGHLLRVSGRERGAWVAPGFAMVVKGRQPPHAQRKALPAGQRAPGETWSAVDGRPRLGPGAPRPALACPAEGAQHVQGCSPSSSLRGSRRAPASGSQRPNRSKA